MRLETDPVCSNTRLWNFIKSWDFMKYPGIGDDPDDMGMEHLNSI